MKQQLLLCIVLISQPVYAQVEIEVPPGEYELITNIVLPNLPDYLTRSTIRKVRCLQRLPASDLFTILEHPSFSGCSFASSEAKQQISDHATSYAYRLTCENRDAATGTAIISVDQSRLFAKLNIKMGAKNMTMTQFLKAKRIGPC
jgi:hypothetical protein